MALKFVARSSLMRILNLSVSLALVMCVVLVICVALVLSVTQSTSAHRPLFAGPSTAEPGSALWIADPSVSHVIYAELTPDAPHRWFVFDNKKPREIKMQIGVPTGSVQRPVEPTVALFGPGLAHPPPTLPIKAPQGENAGIGAVILSESGEPHVFDEPVTGTQSLILVETSVSLPPGVFYGVVFDEGGGEGKVWIGVGQSEGFGWRDVLRLPRWIREVRDFHQVPGWPRWVWVIVMGLSTVFVAFLVWMVRKMRRVKKE